MNPCHLLIRVFGWGQWQIYHLVLYYTFFSSENDFPFSFVRLVLFIFPELAPLSLSLATSWSLPLIGLSASLTSPALFTNFQFASPPSTCFLFFTLFFSSFFSFLFYHWLLFRFIIFLFVFFLYFPPLIRTLPQLPSLQLFNLLPHHPHFSFLFQTFSSYHFLFSVIFPSPLVMTEAQPPSL